MCIDLLLFAPITWFNLFIYRDNSFLPLGRISAYICFYYYLYWSKRVYALLCHSEQLKTCPPLGFGQINSDSLNRVPFIKLVSRQMLINHEQGVEPVT